MEIAYGVLAFVILALIGGCAGLVILRERDFWRFSKEREAWWAERKDLNARIMARDWTSYIGIIHGEAEAAATESQEPVAEEKTKEYDGAWTA